MCVYISILSAAIEAGFAAIERGERLLYFI